MILIVKENVILNSNEVVENEEKKKKVKNDEIAKTFNKHFSKIVDKLSVFGWRSSETDDTEDQLTGIINKNPSIKKIKSN